MADIIKKVAAERAELLDNNKGVTESSRVALSAISGRNVLKTKAEVAKMKRDREIAAAQIQAAIAKNDAAGAVTMAKAQTGAEAQLDRTRRDEILSMINLGIYEDSFAKELGLPAAVVKQFADKKQAERNAVKAARARAAQAEYEAAQAQAEYEATLEEIRKKKEAAVLTGLTGEEQKRIRDTVLAKEPDETATKADVIDESGVVQKGPLMPDWLLRTPERIAAWSNWRPGSPQKDPWTLAAEREAQARAERAEKLRQASEYYDQLLAESIRKKQAADETLSALEKEMMGSVEGQLAVSRLGLAAAETPEEYAAAYESYVKDLEAACNSAFSGATSVLLGVQEKTEKAEELTDEDRSQLDASIDRLEQVRTALEQELKQEDLTVEFQDALTETYGLATART